MWAVAFLGSATAYVESTLGQIHKEVDEGEYRGGPAFCIEKAMGQKWYAWIFAVMTIVATGLLLPGVQSNAIGNAAELALGGGSTGTFNCAFALRDSRFVRRIEKETVWNRSRLPSPTPM